MLRYLVPIALLLTTETVLAAPAPLPASDSAAPARMDAAPKGKGKGSKGVPARGSGSRGSGGDTRGSGGSSGSSRDTDSAPRDSGSSRDSGGARDTDSRDTDSRDSGGARDSDSRDAEPREVETRAPDRSTARPGTSSAPTGSNAQPRSVTAGGTAAVRPGTSLGPSSFTPGAAQPANYRGAAQHAVGRMGGPSSGQAGGASGGPPGASPAGHSPSGRASATARSHHHAAAAHPGHAGPDSRHAAAHHNAWSNRYYSRHPARWGSRLVVAWYPGYPRHWYHGVFVYGPPPGSSRDSEVAPRKKVTHAGDWAIGVRGGVYSSGYTNGASYGDFGLGLAARYRIVDPLGVELAWTYHDQTWAEGTERIDAPLSASAQLFAFSWTKFNPYLSLGVTRTDRNIQDEVGGQLVDQDIAIWGPHVGIGLELGLSKKTSLNLDIRGIGYLNDPDGDLTRQGATQANVGVNFYF